MKKQDWLKLVSGKMICSQKWLIIFSATLILSGCSDPSHPTAKKVLSEIKEKVALNGQINLSSLSEQFDEICAFRQDDSDTGYTLMDMKNLLSKRGISLQHVENKAPENPQGIILLIRNKTAVVAYDGDWVLYYTMFKGLELEDGYSLCKPWPNLIVTKINS